MFGGKGEQLHRRVVRRVINYFARESKARIGRFLRKKLIYDHVLFSSYEGQKGAENGQDSWGVFHGCTGLWAAGYWIARRLQQPKASTTMNLDISIFLISVRCVALRNLDSLIKTDKSKNFPLCCCKGWPWVCDNTSSRSRLLSILWSKEV